jgi:glutamate dehydrogenase
MAASVPKTLAAEDRLDFNKLVKSLVNSGVPRDLSHRIAVLRPMSSAIDIVDVAKETKREIPLVASLYFHLGTALDLQMLRTEISRIGVQTHWHNLAKTKLISVLKDNQMALTAQILKCTRDHQSAKKMYEKWAKFNPAIVERYTQMIAEIKSKATLDFPILSVAVNIVGDLLADGE